MNKSEFKAVLRQHVSAALQAAHVPESTEVDFQVHGGGVPVRHLTFDETADAVFISEDLFYRVMTIGVRTSDVARCTMFVGISGHPPEPFDKTWNQPAGSGPFHVVTPLN